jgi:serine/threonine-protein kinase
LKKRVVPTLSPTTTATVTTDQMGAPGAAMPIRFRVAFGAGSPTADSSDLYAVLLRRLRIFSSLLSGGLSALVGLSLWNLLTAMRSGVVELGSASYTQFVVIGLGVPLAVSAASALVLWLRPPLSLTGLRVIELLVTATVAACLLWGMVWWYELLEGAAAEASRDAKAFRDTYVESTSLRWFCLLVGYGSLIPNTWRRCAAVVSVLALSPLVLIAILGFWIRPLAPGVAITVLMTLAFWVSVAAAVVVFTSYRIEVLREQADQARKLGHYLLKARLGAGGMGEVYLAEHVLLRRPCALKLIRPEFAGNPIFGQRFEREVRMTATLTHPNTVQVFDYGHAEDGTFYYVMEYLPGLTLDDLVRRHGPLPAGRAVHFLRQICGALREAHGIGLIHRDIKPGNVIVCERGGQHDVIKLLDFGLALPRADPDGSEKLTREGTITGTPSYMSPEQVRNEAGLDARSDIYSLGALAYFVLTGAPPFVKRSSVETLVAQLNEDPAPLTTKRAELSADLEAIVLRCLAKDPADRFNDVDDLDKALAVTTCLP